jgi:phage recombination protein Bet
MSMQVKESSSLVEFNEDKLKLIKGMFAKDATDMEFDLFITMSQRLQLDPVIKQIYFVKFSGKMSIIVGIDGYRLIADRTGKYMPGRESTFTYDKDGELFSATSYVKKLGPDGQWHEFAASAIRSEYDTKINQWKKGPHYMLAKCAESLALRKGWPAEFSGTHTEEEMDKAIIDVPAVDTKRQVSYQPVETISIQEAIEIANIVSDDVEQKEKMFKYYSRNGHVVKDYTDLPKSELGTIMKAVKNKSEQRLNEEMSNRSDIEVK